MPVGYGTYLHNPTTNAIGGPLSNPSAVYGSRVPSIPNITGPNLGTVFPNLGGNNAALSSALASELTGQLSPSTLSQINNAAASFGVTSGMPGSGLSMNRDLRDIGLTSEQLIHQGIGDYAGVIPSVSSTQTVTPGQAAGLNAEINAMNATNASAPDPAAAGTYAMNLFDKYLQSLSSPAGGTGGPGSQQGLPWWQQMTTAGGASGFGPQVATTRTFGNGGPFNIPGPTF